MNQDVRSAYSRQNDASAAASEIIHTFRGMEPSAIVVFCSHTHDGAVLSATIKSAFPSAEVVGCSTAGEFTDHYYGCGGVSALAIGPAKVRRCAGALADFSGGVSAGIERAAQTIGERLQVDIREIDPERFVGLVFIDSVGMKEELANEALGNIAPFLSFVGGSAGDDIRWAETWVFHDGDACNSGAALLLLDMAAPFTVVKSCSFRPSGKTLTISRADPGARIVHEIGGRRAADAYAAAIGVPAPELDVPHFMANPVGLMIDGKPWLRSIVRTVGDGGLQFACHILEGMEVSLMEPTDLLADTAAAWEQAQTAIGGPIAGGLLFDCALRRVEVESRGLQADYHRAIAKFPMAGFHTHGESWLGHINQTLTSLVFG